MPRRIFSDEDLAAIGRAAGGAELGSAGEVVPYIVGRCDDYPEAAWCAAVLGALVAPTALALLELAGSAWRAPLSASWALLGLLGGAALGYLLGATWPALARLLVGPERLARRVHERAETAFLEEEVFATHNRTGILVLVALFEHRAEILADAGIHAAVSQAEWQAIADDLASGIREGRAAEAMIEAIEACGALLREREVHAAAELDNELPDAPRVQER